MRATVEKICSTCKQPFRALRAEDRRRNGVKYCSRDCYRRSQRGETAAHWKGGQIERICPTCTTTFHVDPNIVKRGWGKYCSQPCYWAQARGEGHWKYGKRRKHRDAKGTPRYAPGFTARVRRQVIARDKVCVDCGLWDPRPRCMQIHHIDGGCDNHALSNLELLCGKCHWKRHRYSSGQRAAGVVDRASAT